jgi:type IX secretion system PorP/SprF family membrane protein
MCKNKHTIFTLKKATLFLVFFIFALSNINSQDIHFSQFKSTPLFLNAANTGTSTSAMRFTNDYRNQWRKIDNPFNTLMLGLDSRISILNSRFGVGAMMVHDQSLSNYLTTDKFYLSFSHSFFYKNNQFSFGLQPGFVLKKLNDNILTFGSQFDPNSHIFNPNNPSNESGLLDNFNYFDLNLGILWQSRIKDLVPAFGVGINHINRPVESFYADTTTDPLPIKSTFHGNIFIPITEKFAVEPMALYSYTKGSKEFLGGAMFYYLPVENTNGITKIYGISEIRINPVRNFDAMVFGAGIEIAGFDFCFTYDLNVSSLRKFSRYQGAYEISLLYNFNIKKIATKAEPCFML